MKEIYYNLWIVYVFILLVIQTSVACEQNTET